MQETTVYMVDDVEEKVPFERPEIEVLGTLEDLTGGYAGWINPDLNDYWD